MNQDRIVIPCLQGRRSGHGSGKGFHMITLFLIGIKASTMCCSIPAFDGVPFPLWEFYCVVMPKGAKACISNAIMV